MMGIEPPTFGSLAQCSLQTGSKSIRVCNISECSLVRSITVSDMIYVLYIFIGQAKILPHHGVNRTGDH